MKDNIILIIGPCLALITAVITFYLNEKAKRKHVLYLEKLKLYQQLMLSVSGFYKGKEMKDLRQAFHDNIGVAWVYASENVIEAADELVETTRVGKKEDDSKRSDALHKFAAAIREDMKLRSPKVKFKSWISF